MFSVVEFAINPNQKWPTISEEFSSEVVPNNWLKTEGGKTKCLWPKNKKNVRKMIKKATDPNKRTNIIWENYECTILASYRKQHKQMDIHILNYISFCNFFNFLASYEEAHLKSKKFEKEGEFESTDQDLPRKKTQTDFYLVKQG